MVITIKMEGKSVYSPERRPIDDGLLPAAGLLIMAAIEFAGQLVALLIGLEPTA